METSADHQAKPTDWAVSSPVGLLSSMKLKLAPSHILC